jgi:alpha-ketoglutarate-dependent taurine dioxygenase
MSLALRNPAVLRTVPLDPADLAASARGIVEAWRDALIVSIRPTAPLAADRVRDVYAELLPLVGTPHYLAEDARIQSREAQRTGELWFEVRYDPAIKDSYRNSANAQPLHTDGSYIAEFPNATLMCCVTNAAEGGETVFITAEDLVAALASEEPALLAALEETTVPHARSGDTRSYPVIRREDGELRLNWNYYCVAGDATAEVQALRERLFAYLRDSPAVRRAITPVKLAPGDAVVWKDERLLHGRNAFVASSVGERFLWKCAVDVGVFR